MLGMILLIEERLDSLIYGIGFYEVLRFYIV